MDRARLYRLSSHRLLWCDLLFAHTVVAQMNVNAEGSRCWVNRREADIYQHFAQKNSHRKCLLRSVRAQVFEGTPRSRRSQVVRNMRIRSMKGVHGKILSGQQAEG